MLPEENMWIGGASCSFICRPYYLLSAQRSSLTKLPAAWQIPPPAIAPPPYTKHPSAQGGGRQGRSIVHRSPSPMAVNACERAARSPNCMLAVYQNGYVEAHKVRGMDLNLSRYSQSQAKDTFTSTRFDTMGSPRIWLSGEHTLCHTIL